MNTNKTILDFGRSESPRWSVIDDGVMGGRSRSSIRPTDDGTGLFTGRLSLENNGGFASVRADMGSLDVSGFDGLEIQVRGDGRSYQLRLRDDGRYDGVAYKASFVTRRDTWTTVRLPVRSRSSSALT